MNVLNETQSKCVIPHLTPALKMWKGSATNNEKKELVVGICYAESMCEHVIKGCTLMQKTDELELQIHLLLALLASENFTD